MMYRGVEIEKTNNVCLSRNGKRLYKLSGKIERNAVASPFLATLADAKRFIDEQLMLDEIA